MAAKPKILVTGANGQLGRDIRILSDAYKGFEFVFLSRTDMPIHHFELVRNYFKTIQPQYCINCAAYTAVDRAEEEKGKAFQVNGEAVGVLAAVCNENNCRLIHISTDYVFDGAATFPYKEDSPTNPQSVYGASKLEGEKQAMQYNPDTIIIRTSWVYSTHGKNFVRTILKLLQEKNEISVVNDQFGSPTYAADLAETILRIISNCKSSIANWAPGIYHYCNEGVISWYDFATAIKGLTGSACKINPVPTSAYPTQAKRPAYSALDTSAIQQVFGTKLKNWKTSLGGVIHTLKEGKL